MTKRQSFRLGLSSETQKTQLRFVYTAFSFLLSDPIMKPKNNVFKLVFLLVLLETSTFLLNNVESKCLQGCPLALASYYARKTTLNNIIKQYLRSDLVSSYQVVSSYNKQTVLNGIYIQAFTRINIPFPCDCINNGDFLGHVFEYTIVKGDTYDSIATKKYASLTTVDLLRRFNNYSDPDNLPLKGKLNVTVNCSCGNRQVSKDYGLFITYPLKIGDSLQSIVNQTGLDATLLQSYNPGVNFSQQSGVVFIPGKDQNGNYVSLDPRYISSGLNGVTIGGISVGATFGFLLLAGYVFVRHSQRKTAKVALFTENSIELSNQDGKLSESGSVVYETSGSSGSASATGLIGIMVGKSVEFSYQEIAKATNNFSSNNKIGQGGFGAVYYAELRGQKTAIKKMDIEASQEFLAELKVLTHVHHLNLVRLIGYCVEGSLFLVYEYINNGNLSHHLRSSDPLPWSTRVQIALDSARGLEYIHEHTVPVYIHRDVKSLNILIDKSFHAKVADFGLSKLIEVGNASLNTRLVGTFGYMSPEYAQYGITSPKIDVYAFGVVLYELISAKNAVLKTGDQSVAESKGLVSLFEKSLRRPDAVDDLRNLVDPRLGENYPIESVFKMAQLARACTQDDPQLRPTMRSIVVALMTLSSSDDQDCDVAFDLPDNQTIINLLSGR
ncbi:lysM domain receptor-like kinase 3 isoform X2 [Prosopis cineraria]|uniref:lysM domain receptor-like kinase 3 isoform X2 n=1 Tax=Prosopis cineraria TaxID=364024 RepID=UPI0024105B0A|nr:lysM domain receptor-like kinase 3 isoform X2 [Prosopis cineraria]